MLDAWEIRKRIAYAERRLRERLAEANDCTTQSQACSTPLASGWPPALWSADKKWVALQTVGAT